MLKAYSRTHQSHDMAAWRAMQTGRAVRGTDVFGPDFTDGPYYHNFLLANGFAYVAAAPLKSPILQGYPGVAIFLRKQSEGDFSDNDLREMEKAARPVDHAAPHLAENGNSEPWIHRAPTRFYAFDSEGKLVYPASLELDGRLQQQISEHVSQALERNRRDQTPGDRLVMPDARGDLWVFRIVVAKKYPALGGGPFVFVSLQPDSDEWVAVRPADLQADPDMVRLLPTLRYMRTEFARTPTLTDIAKKAHLSPFHFHRRFTGEIGQTPKHFMLNCQIQQAKRLLAKKRPLAKIAKDCGFAHQSHFTSRFKQATGLTPTRWRRLAAELTRDADGGNNF